MLYLALALQRNLCVRPAVFGTVLGTSGPSAQVALQCEIPAIGAAAWQLAAIGAELFHAVPGESRTAPELIGAATVPMRDFSTWPTRWCWIN